MYEAARPGRVRHPWRSSRSRRACASWARPSPSSAIPRQPDAAQGPADRRSPGDVLVASAGGYPDAGYWGGLMATSAVARKLGRPGHRRLRARQRGDDRDGVPRVLPGDLHAGHHQGRPGHRQPPDPLRRGDRQPGRPGAGRRRRDRDRRSEGHGEGPRRPADRVANEEKKSARPLRGHEQRGAQQARARSSSALGMVEAEK
ncbi:MAG: hypothetical protein MZV63_60210 [Marinilabiliales bacterium]|nr:hypothetical protein [Marinilabiliales bacterium]